MSNIYIIRHGQTNLNKNQVLQGRVDEPLNEDGVRQAKAAAALLRSLDVSIDQVWSSPLQRAQDTAAIIVGENVPIRTDDRLLEMDYGPFEGTDLTSPPPEIIRFFGDFVNQPAPEGMESLSHVTQRLGGFLEELRSNPPEGDVLISTHAIAMKGALEYLTPDAGGSYWGKHIKNCDVYVTTLEDGTYTVPVPVEEQGGTVQLQTDRLILRRHKGEDAEVLFRNFGLDPKMFEYSGWNPYATLEMAKETVCQFIENYADERFYGWAVEHGGRLIGTVGAYDYNPETDSIEIGCSIERESWGRGFAGEAVSAVLDYLTRQAGIWNVKAWCAADNIASMKVMEKAGMKRVSVEPGALEIDGHKFDKLNYEFCCS
ncbi:MAG: GNAT family N-acetyltransferase [Clostridiales bacterium]|nr:GNAT family N-acetyltransferase [Clostridiales bacterium]